MNSPRHAALVTGGSSGIGLAVAGALVARGFAVTVLGRDPGRLRGAADRLGAAVAGRGSSATGEAAVHAVVADVAAPEAAQAAVAAHVERWGRLDVLVNSAGVLAAGPFDSYSAATVAEVLDVDLRATILFCQAALPYLRKVARDGRPLIANIASISGKRADAGFSLYCAAKFGVVGFTAALHQELLGEGVAACAICPGLVDTPMADWARSWAPRSSMLRPEDIAGAVLRLVDLPAGQVPAELVLS
ncbi:SDR family oxidoreductase [Sphaerisporangium perillae]|uniref:SDR family oxidoreductase n=1 Tax=Sphaerisporangium perillae TaxID=2935860 RepID=UPI00200DE839|nr:SDR family oxidoreductase [Sphaerisporangium perillae]